MNASPLERSETFTVGETARLKLVNIRGQVDLQPGEPGVIAITATRHSDGHSADTHIELSQAADGTVSAITHDPTHGLGWLSRLGRGRPARVDYVVRTPPQCSVELSIVEGAARVQGLSGQFELHTVSGSLHLADISGSLRVHTVSGDVLGERISADPVQLSAVSGSVTLVEADLPAVSASTVSGDLRLQTRLGAGPYSFNSVSGDIRLSVPAATRCALSLHSMSGRVHSNVAFTSASAAGEDSPRPSVRLHSVSGDLYLLSSEAAAETTSANTAQPPAPPQPHQAPAPPDRRALLEQLSRGELSVDEAVSAMKGQ